MQTRRSQLGYEMTLLPPLEQLVPPDHRLRKLNRVLDLSFIHAAVRDRYCQDNGRPSVDPEVVLRLFVLQAIEGIRSVRELMNEVQVNLAYRWFIGYDLSEPLPDHSTLSRALDRFGDAVFDRLFAESVGQCRRSGLIKGEVFHLDATLIRADIQKDQAGKPGCADPDARHSRKKGLPGYKQQTVVDGQTRVIVDVSVMPANRHDQEGAIEAVDRAMMRTDRVPETLCADSAYANGPNAEAMEDRGIRLVSPPQQIRTKGTPADPLTVDEFIYDVERNVLVCPAGEILVYVGIRTSDGRRRRRYRAAQMSCANCALKARCTTSGCREVSIGDCHAALARLRADSRTDSFQVLYRKRAPVIEGIFGEGKLWHRLGRAWRRGLPNMLIQSLLVAAVLNFKRLAAAGSPLLRLLQAISGLSLAFQTTMWPQGNPKLEHLRTALAASTFA